MKKFKKNKRKKITALKKAAAAIILLLTIYSVIAFSKSDFFKISDLHCEKENNICSDREVSFFSHLLAKNIFVLDVNKEAELIKNRLPYLKIVIINKKLPDKLLIKIGFRKEFVLLETGEQRTYLLDDEGFVLGEVEKKPSALPEITAPDLCLNPAAGEQMKESEIQAGIILLKVCQESLISISRIIIQSNQALTLDLNNGLLATLSADKDILYQVDSLQFILRQSKIEGKVPKKIDLRFDKPVAVF